MAQSQQPQMSDFVRIDNAIEKYWFKYGGDEYRNKSGHGKFLQYILDEELNDEDLPISKELGPDSDPNDCAYSWINNDVDKPFPMPSYVIIQNNQQKEEYIFYLLQYCYKHGQPPSDQCTFILVFYVHVRFP